MAVAAFTGGARLRAKLAEIARKVSDPATLRVGFLEGAQYGDTGVGTAMVAAILEFGARIEREPGEQSIFRKLNAAGTGFVRKGKFVKARIADFETKHYVGAYVITIPARPYMRSWVATKSPDWGKQLGALLVAQNYNAKRALKELGKGMEGELRQAMVDFSDPPNAPSTIAKKGFNRPLSDTGYLIRSADSEVV